MIEILFTIVVVLFGLSARLLWLFFVATEEGE